MTEFRAIIGKKNRPLIVKYFDLNKIADKQIQIYQDILNNFCYKRTQIKKKKNLKLPLLLWLKEKRIETIKNKNYYIIKNGKILFKQKFGKIT